MRLVHEGMWDTHGKGDHDRGNKRAERAGPLVAEVDEHLLRVERERCREHVTDEALGRDGGAGVLAVAVGEVVLDGVEDHVDRPDERRERDARHNPVHRGELRPREPEEGDLG